MNQEKNQIALIDTRSLEELKQSREMLRQYIQGQMTDSVDFGVIPGTHKPTLFKPGAEKLAKLFRLGARIIDKSKDMDIEKGYAFFSYTIEMYHLDSGRVISQCEGSANTLETKNRNKKFGDLLNTLQKMAQKRAYVGAVISGVGASDFYTQDMEDTHIPHAEREPEVRNVTRSEPDGDLRVLSEGQILPYRIPFGKYKGKALEEVGHRAVEEYCDYILRMGEKEGKKRDDMSTVVQEFFDMAEKYVFGGKH